MKQKMPCCCVWSSDRIVFACDPAGFFLFSYVLLLHCRVTCLLPSVHYLYIKQVCHQRSPASITNKSPTGFQPQEALLCTCVYSGCQILFWSQQRTQRGFLGSSAVPTLHTLHDDVTQMWCHGVPDIMQWHFSFGAKPLWFVAQFTIRFCPKLEHCRTMSAKWWHQFCVISLCCKIMTTCNSVQ